MESKGPPGFLTVAHLDSLAYRGAGNPLTRQASSGAQPAKPQTLRFALELSNNVSSSVKDVV